MAISGASHKTLSVSHTAQLVLSGAGQQTQCSTIAVYTESMI